MRVGYANGSTSGPCGTDDSNARGAHFAAEVMDPAGFALVNALHSHDDFQLPRDWPSETVWKATDRSTHWSRRCARWRELDLIYLPGCDCPKVRSCGTFSSCLELDHRHKLISLDVEEQYQYSNRTEQKRSEDEETRKAKLDQRDRNAAPLWRATDEEKERYSAEIVRRYEEKEAEVSESGGSVTLIDLVETIKAASPIVQASADLQLQKYNRSHDYRTRRKLQDRIRLLRRKQRALVLVKDEGIATARCAAIQLDLAEAEKALEAFRSNQ
ncbi:unnamed protein product, partial [Amoebophrya sp. A25]|eukprot:GSA25T00006141001.1